MTPTKTITLPDGRTFRVELKRVNIDGIGFRSVLRPPFKAHQLISIGDPETLRLIEEQITKEKSNGH